MIDLDELNIGDEYVDLNHSYYLKSCEKGDDVTLYLRVTGGKYMWARVAPSAANFLKNLSIGSSLFHDRLGACCVVFGVKFYPQSINKFYFFGLL